MKLMIGQSPIFSPTPKMLALALAAAASIFNPPALIGYLAFSDTITRRLPRIACGVLFAFIIFVPCYELLLAEPTRTDNIIGNGIAALIPTLMFLRTLCAALCIYPMVMILRIMTTQSTRASKARSLALPLLATLILSLTSIGLQIGPARLAAASTASQIAYLESMPDHPTAEEWNNYFSKTGSLPIENMTDPNSTLMYTIDQKISRSSIAAAIIAEIFATDRNRPLIWAISKISR